VSGRDHDDVMPPAFSSVDDVIGGLASHGYIADRRLGTTVFLLTRINKPVLMEGPAGVGKTELAKTLAAASGRRLVRLQCYEGQDETKALYEWDYGKQLLYTQMLRDKIGEITAGAPDLAAAMRQIGEQDSVFFSDRFLAPRPLLDAIKGEHPAVLLIDEIDRADEALEAVLLECLAEFQVSVPEIGTYTAKVPPYVVLTSNNSRDLSAALKRRCLHLFLDYPDAERELEILRSKDTGLPEAAARHLIAVVRGLRDLRLRKSPSISETIDWARTLAVLGVAELDATILAETANVVLKYERDLHRALDVLPVLVDPNRELPAVADGHDHPHGHRHHHGDGYEAGSIPADGDEPDGRTARAEMDRPGRHDRGYYGAPTSGPIRPTVPRDGKDRGSRSFAAFTRRRPG